LYTNTDGRFYRRKRNGNKMKNKPKYTQQYCKKHNQEYADYLHQCPICRGEKLSEDLKSGKVKWDKLWNINK
jgi:hypothetical protein